MAILEVDVVEEDAALVTDLAEFSWGDEEEPGPAGATAIVDPMAGFDMDALLIW